MAARVAQLMERFGLGDDDRAAWARSGLGGAAFDDWLTDRVARRPSGRRAQAVYGAGDIRPAAHRAQLGAAQCTSDGIRRAPVISNTQKSSPSTGTETL
jgi:hypothetical protein